MNKNFLKSNSRVLNLYALHKEYKMHVFNKFIQIQEGIENLDKR